MGKLADLQRDENIRILFAIESGSRAWGFPSPDSDYDVRFVYSRPIDWYLSISPGRDVVELPLEGDYDINGWDIKKALGLLIKPNPVLLEWLSSPIRYIWNDQVCNQLIEFSKSVTHGPACLHHYLNLGQEMWRRNVEPFDDVKLKKYFYIVRPAMAIKWMRLNPEIIPPMNFQNLLAGIDVSKDLTVALEDLLIAKSKAKEIGKARRIEIIDEFITSEFAWATEAVKTIKSNPQKLRPKADKIFRAILNAN